MRMGWNLFRKLGYVRSVGLVIILAGTLLFVFRGYIRDHKVTRTKMEMFKAMSTQPPAKWDDAFLKICDSLWAPSLDSTKTSFVPGNEQ